MTQSSISLFALLIDHIDLLIHRLFNQHFPNPTKICLFGLEYELELDNSNYSQLLWTAAASDLRQTDPKALPVLHGGALVLAGLRRSAAHLQPLSHVVRAAAVSDLGILSWLVRIGPRIE